VTATNAEARFIAAVRERRHGDQPADRAAYAAARATVAPVRPSALIAALAVVVAAGLPSASPAYAEAEAPAITDAIDAGGPLDLVEASLEQRDVQMFLRIATAGAWSHPALAATAGRELCITLSQGEPAIPRGRICVATSKGRRALEYRPLASDGSAGEARVLAARVEHPSARVLRASFLPAAAGLSVGPYSWSVQSEWTDTAACARTCADHLPDAGAIPAQLGLLGAPPCFGAAARDPAGSCDAVAAPATVEPPPSRAKVLLPPYCDRVAHPGLLTTCAFGAPAGAADGTFALIGDSHAASLKTPLEVVTLARRWRGISIVRAACPVTQAARPILPTSVRSRQCVRWNDEVLRWLEKHPEVRTVFLSTHAGAKVTPSRGADMFATMRAGYRAAIERLLRRVRRVVVVRDIPRAAPGHLRCVANALASGDPTAAACTLDRDSALLRDPLAEAARDVRSPRAKLIDLTNHFCDDRRCFSVVGGALVHHDETHMTTPFGASLGPFLLRALSG
jgi:hypothetical protein